MATVCAFQHDQYFMVSGNCMIRKDLLQLYKLVQDEIYDSLDVTRTQMLSIYRELLEKYAGKLNQFCCTVNSREIKPAQYKSTIGKFEAPIFCIGQNTADFATVNDEIEIIKESLNRYLQKSS